ncbi:MAG TPA: bifunctional phosphopantothenoylcysteine decarboxylase/phosphopantothenate--cysteine ligase CoaBC [Gammaproteobacteria bacterium]|nr:bifunctional phosphopantothenoylcysteine decarboxylase/phosphopantothenate--cysteine ligase CoaBC [Gammaproteobacteria bacterium]
MPTLNKKHILLGVTGGIAAYKSAEIIRRLREQGAEVRVVMTPAAKEFITPLTFQALSGHQVLSDWDQQSSAFAMDHIAEARWADIILVAPATADFMAKLAHGFAGDMLTTLCLAANAPIVIAPAMNQQMWSNPATWANKNLLLERGVRLLGPAAGSQACGEEGVGRMLEPAEITALLSEQFSCADLNGVQVMITAGPTQEPIDAVRYISNYSSGKMGYALAAAAAARGAEVLLISGPVNLPCPIGVKRICVETAQQMQDVVIQHIDTCEIFIASAAVADYRCAEVNTQKIKKNPAGIQLNLVPNPDILAQVAQRPNPPFTVGFAAETENLRSNALQKLAQKNLDMIAANDVSSSHAGFHADQNALLVLWSHGEEEFSLRPKTQLAADLLKLIIQRFIAKKQGA